MTTKIIVTAFGLVLLFIVSWYFLFSKNRKGKREELNK
jgi:cbb3-type cytochrome oxidase subunit 3